MELSLAGIQLPVAGHAPPPTVQHGEYRPDIDGLRAVAVLGVLVYHAAPQLMPGGFAGVDVFFVISGFLISGIIFRAMERGSFSYLDFYARRIKRIFPALIAMLVAVWACAWPMFLWDEYQRLGKHILAGVGFALNLILYADFNLYFGVTTSPLIHLWSLGVEEQFYIFWPIFLMALWKWGKGRSRVAAIAVVALVSFAMNIAALSADPTASFYLPSSRIWELAIGSMLAYVRLGEGALAGTAASKPHAAPGLVRTWWRVHHLQGFAGAILIVLAFYVLRSNFAFPGWWALLPCVGALLLVSAGPGSWVNRYVLSSPPMVFVGLISYPLYLWHWPLLSIGHVVMGSKFTPMLALIAVSAAFVLATLTYKYIELPIRSSRNKTRVPAALCAMMVVCAGVGYLTSARTIPARSESYDLDRFIRASSEDWLSQEQMDWTWHTKDFLRLGSDPREVLFIGDSNMQQYYPRIEKILADRPRNARSATFAVRAACAPMASELLPAGNTYATATCKSFQRQALEYARRPQVETIVIGAYWRGFLLIDARNFSDNAMKPESGVILEDLRAMIADLTARGKRVYIVLNIPTSPQFDPRQMIRRSFKSPGFTANIRSPTRAEIEAAVGTSAVALRRVAQRAGAAVIDPVEFLCNEVECSAVARDSEPIYHDFAHLRPSYVRENVRFLDTTVLDSETLQSRAGE